jgi:hypothetical protein
MAKLIMEWIPRERSKRGRPRKTWMEGVQAAMTTSYLEPDQWRNREERRLVSGRRRQMLKIRIDRFKIWRCRICRTKDENKGKAENIKTVCV